MSPRPERLLAPSPGRRWVMAGAVVALLAVAAAGVSLEPEVSGDFFFASNDPQLRDEQRLDELFPAGRQPMVLLSAAGSEVGGGAYLRRLAELSRRVRAVEGVAEVYDLHHGPKDAGDAFESPFWSRLLIAPDRSATQLIVRLDDPLPPATIPALEAIAREASEPDFDVVMAGVPYVVSKIREDLTRDLRVFGLVAAGLFAGMVLLLFRSPGILTGALLACLAAAGVTMLAGTWLGVMRGLLAPTVSTIVVVMTLSHVVFLAMNWLEARRSDEAEPVRAAMGWTGAASCWAMVTTLAGFGSLLLAPAQPMREFGLACAVGSGAALVAAHLVFPPFLSRAVPHPLPGRIVRPVEGLLARPLPLAALVAIALMVVVGAVGSTRLVRDPHLLSYFDQDSEVRRGLERVDRTLGVGQLELGVRHADGETLDDKAAYLRLQELQRALEDDPDVVVSVSLPVLMEEARRPLLSKLLSWKQRLRRLDRPKYGAIGKQFVTADRELAHFTLWLREEGRDEPRQVVIERIHGIVREAGFVPRVTGGLYRLAGDLSRLVFESLVKGLLLVLGLFLAVGTWIARSVRTGLAMAASLTLVAASILGVIGLLGLPLDLLSSPALTVALAIGIDDMIHLTFATRRRAGRDGAAWVEARLHLWRPIVVSSVVVASGFAIFLLSASPPTRRLGFVVAAGAIVALAVVLFVFPVLAGALSARGAKVGRPEAPEPAGPRPKADLLTRGARD